MEKISKKMLEVVKAIHDRGGVASAHEISEQSKISYVTTQKYLKELKNMKIITEIIEDKTQGKIKRYSINYDFLRSEDVD